MQFHGAAQRGRCRAGDLGDALGRKARVQPGWLFFSSRLSSLQQERMSSSTPQHGESSSRSWVRASASRAQARPLRGDTAVPEPPPRHQHGRPRSAVLTGLGEPPAVSPRGHRGRRARPPAETRRLGRGPCRAPQDGRGVTGRSGGTAAVGRVPGHPMAQAQRGGGCSRPPKHLRLGTVSTRAETSSVQHGPALPPQQLQGAGGNPLPTQPDPKQILPLWNTCFRLRNCRSSA